MNVNTLVTDKNPSIKIAEFDYNGKQKKIVAYSKKYNNAILLNKEIPIEVLLQKEDKYFNFKKEKTIFFKKIIGSSWDFSFLKYFEFLLTKTGKIFCFFLLFPCILTFSLIKFISQQSKLYSNFFDTNSLLVIILFCICLLIQTIFHEFGHLTAMKKNKLSLSGVGVGIYLTSVVLFVPMYESWLLKRKQRLEIDIAGIIFQLYFIFIVLMVNLFIKSELVNIYILFSTMILLNNFNPFLKYDGYWILSDHLGVYNLHKWIRISIKNMFTNSEELTAVFYKHTIIKIKCYSLITSIFLVFFLFMLFRINVTNITELIVEANIFRLFYTVFIAYFTLLAFKSIIRVLWR
ncbi:hypothetical protein BKP45_10635 [Anaerobacillus alkalidiazotrophicus]|uniref:Peptidase M50 domain-containing protein n=1 Tax=Anaerobacillus alkalidiazotrophicus TaxID=472963 RepID=A0A1S2M0M1_9BACI|nr:M50 family metallopeptidase [Anaerobacillus alkalidiazotrophicus]OIJ18050.1 hypothetical protein BKP45_16350 [Anaerobacillus alkalidiazotrophicus]OIJ19529.1 hypothetical protein BKP45_10635 [Anaerobacillus alkalidiazotrophicus]